MFDFMSACRGDNFEPILKEVLYEIAECQSISGYNQEKLTQLRKTKPQYNEVCRALQKIVKVMNFYKMDLAGTLIQKLEYIYDLTNEPWLQFRWRSVEDHSPKQILYFLSQKSSEFAERELLCHYLLKLFFNNSQSHIQLHYPSHINQVGVVILNTIISLFKQAPKFKQRFNQEIYKLNKKCPQLFDSSALKQYWSNGDLMNDSKQINFGSSNFEKKRPKRSCELSIFKSCELSIFNNCKSETYRPCEKKFNNSTTSTFTSIEDEQQSLFNQIRRAMQKMEPKFKEISHVIPSFSSAQMKIVVGQQNEEMNFVRKIMRCIDSIFEQYRRFDRQYKTFKLGSNMNEKKLLIQKQELKKQIQLIKLHLSQLQEDCEFLKQENLHKLRGKKELEKQIQQINLNLSQLQKDCESLKEENLLMLSQKRQRQQRLKQQEKLRESISRNEDHVQAEIQSLREDNHTLTEKNKSLIEEMKIVNKKMEDKSKAYDKVVEQQNKIKKILRNVEEDHE